MEDKIRRFEDYLSGLMKNAATVKYYVADFEGFIEFVKENYEVADFYGLPSKEIKGLGEKVLKTPKYIDHEEKYNGRLRAAINKYLEFTGSKERVKGGYSPSYKNENVKIDKLSLEEKVAQITEIISKAAKEKDIVAIIEEEGFYFQKGQDALKKWIDYPVRDELKKELIKLSKDYRKIQEEASGNQEISDILDIIFEIITYCDTNAKEKNTRNKYDDKRAIAKAYVRMDVWVEKLVSFKFEPDIVSEGSPKNAINYLIDPENNATVLSENHRKLISENLFQKRMYEPENFVANLKLFFEQFGYFAKNSENNTHLYSSFIYFLKDFWSESKDIDSPFSSDEKADNLNHPLNLILYGPPGTGKTYNTINKALEIIDGFVPENRSDCEKRFAELKQAEQIEFITFHQSYSYEDFVEGIKPKIDGGNLGFLRKDGVFKIISERAKENLEKSRKSKQALTEEKILDLKVQDFLNNSLENGTEFLKTQGGRFKVIDLTDEVIEVESDDSKYSDKKVILSVNEFKKIIDSGIEFESSKNLAQTVFGVNNQRQKDTYYYNLFKDFKKFDFSGYENVVKEQEQKKTFVLIIDEINRGNISRIFGELITLIEEDKRDGKLTAKLPYSQEDFTVPSNLFIIGTMNTADRSIALLDIALRRRFTFFRFDPDSTLVKFPKARNIMEKLNEEIVKSKGKDFQIGHSYFMKVTNDEELETVLTYKIKPLLEEYFVNDPNKLKEFYEIIDR